MANFPVNYNKLVDLTEGVDFIDNKYQRLGDLGIFTPRPVFQSTVQFDVTDQTLELLDDTRGRGKAPLSSKDRTSKILSYAMPEFNYSDYITPDDIRGIRAPHEVAMEEALGEIEARKMEKLRSVHEATHEFLRWQAIKGLITTPDGNVYGDLFADFGVTQKVVTFDFTTNTNGFKAQCSEILRHIEDNARAGVWTGGVRVFVDEQFFDALVTHPAVVDVYNQYQNLNQIGGAQVNRDDLGRIWGGRQFFYNGIMFEEHRGGYTLRDGTFQRFIGANQGHAVPEGMDDAFVMYMAPANKFSYMGTAGREMYAWRYPAQNDEQIEIESFSSVLPICKRPQVLVKVVGA